MYVQQSHSVLFFPKRDKTRSTTGKVPIYARLVIDGQSRDRVVKGVLVHPDHWDAGSKTVKAAEPQAKTFNKKLAQLLTDICRGIDLVQAKHQVASPQAVWELLEAPVPVAAEREEKKINLAFSHRLDDLVKDYVNFMKKKAKAYEFTAELPPAKTALLEESEKLLHRQIEQLEAEGNRLFDNKKWTKTVVLAVDEHLLHFMKMVKSEHRSFTTLQKMLGRKGRLVQFIETRYKQDDLPLHTLEFKFIEQLETFCLTRCQMTPDTASKYTATFKDIITRPCPMDGCPPTSSWPLKAPTNSPNVNG